MGHRLSIAPATDARTWQVAGASVAGLSHVARNQPGQDAWCSAVIDGVVVVAVADGAGSASRGGQGAEAAVSNAVSAVVAAIEAGDPDGLRHRADALVAGAVVAARMAVEAEANALTDQLGEEPGRMLASLASTLAVVVATPDWVAAAVVGDAAVVVDTSSDLLALGAVERGEYLNETTFVASPDWSDELRVDVHDGPVAAVAALTDGLQLLALDLASGRPHQPFFRPLFAFAADRGHEGRDELAAFLSSARVVERTDDDCTIVLAVPVGAGDDHPA